MKSEYPLQRYELLNAIFELNNSATQRNKKSNQKMIKLDKDHGIERNKSLNSISMTQNKLSLSRNIFFLQEELLKANNKIDCLQHSQKEMRLQYEIRLAFYRKKLKKSQRDLSVDENKNRAFKAFFMYITILYLMLIIIRNILSDLANLYMIASNINKLNLNSIQGNLGQGIEDMIIRYDNIPTYFDRSSNEFQKVID